MKDAFFRQNPILTIIAMAMVLSAVVWGVGSLLTPVLKIEVRLAEVVTIALPALVLAGAIQTVARLEGRVPEPMLLFTTAAAIVVAAVIVVCTGAPRIVFWASFAVTAVGPAAVSLSSSDGTVKPPEMVIKARKAVQDLVTTWTRRELHGAEEVQPRSSNGSV